MEGLAVGAMLFGHLRGLATSLRLPDLNAWTHSLGCARGGVGWFFPWATGRRERSRDADEERPALLAQQVVAALVKARAVVLTVEIETISEDKAEDCDPITQSPTIGGLGRQFMLWRPGLRRG